MSELVRLSPAAVGPAIYITLDRAYQLLISRTTSETRAHDIKKANLKAMLNCFAGQITQSLLEKIP